MFLNGSYCLKHVAIFNKGRYGMSNLYNKYLNKLEGAAHNFFIVGANVSCPLMHTISDTLMGKLCIRGPPGYQPVTEKKVWKFVAPPFHFDHLLTQVPKSLYFIHGSESAKIFAHIFLGLAAIERFVSKKSQKYRFLI